MLLSLSSCVDADAFSCQSDQQCTGEGGVCQLSGYCSFDDDDCASGQRYGEFSGPLSRACVPPGMEASTGPAPGSDEAPSPEGGDTTTGPLSTGGVDSLDTGPTDDVTSVGETSTGVEETTGPFVDPDLVLWLEFEARPDGTALDSSPFMNHGQCLEGQCPASAQGWSGSAAAFDGIDDVIEVPYTDDFHTSTGLTIALWMWLDVPPLAHHALLAKPFGDLSDNSWELFFYPSKVSTNLIFNMHIDGTNNVVIFPGPHPVEQWVHVAATWDGAMSTLWVDGVEVGSRAVPEIQLDDHPVLVGADSDTDPPFEGFFPGRIDDVRVYQRALEPSEIEQLHAGR